MHFLILSSSPQKHLVEALKEAGHTYDLAAPKDFQMYLSNKAEGYDAIYRDGKPITRKMYDAVIPRIGSDRAFGARLLRHFEYNLGVYCLQSGRAIDICADKWETSQLLSANKVRIPKQLFVKDVENFDFLLGKLGGSPIIAKPTQGSMGVGVMKLVDEESTRLVLEFVHKTNQGFILQEYIDTSNSVHGGEDLRIHVLNGKVISAMKRTAPKNKLRANISTSAAGKKFKCTPEIEKLAIAAVEAIPGLNYGGVDVMVEPHPDGEKLYVIEVNGNSGTKIIDIVGYNHFIDIVEFLEHHAPLFRRTYDKHNETRELLPDGVEMRDIANAFGRLMYVGSIPNITKRDFDNLVGDLENSFTEHGNFIVRQALNLYSEQSENRSYQY